MRSSYFVLYSAVFTHAATALLLACALYVLGRYYPRHHLRLWGAAWLAEAAHLSLGTVSLMLREAGTPGTSIGLLLATWVSQSGGYLHAALRLHYQPAIIKNDDCLQDRTLSGSARDLPIEVVSPPTLEHPTWKFDVPGTRVGTRLPPMADAAWPPAPETRAAAGATCAREAPGTEA